MFIDVFISGQFLQRFSIDEYRYFKPEGDWQQRAKSREEFSELLFKSFLVNRMPSWAKDIKGVEYFMVFESSMNKADLPVEEEAEFTVL